METYTAEQLSDMVVELQGRKENKVFKMSDNKNYQKELEEFLKENPIQSTIDKICKDILEQKNSAMAMEFTRVICELLRKNGVYVHCTKTKFSENITENSIEENYGIKFDSVDFSQHDKEFTDKIDEMQSEINRLQNEYAEALRRLEKRQARTKELESKQYDGILFISVDGKPKAYTEETLCEMAKVYEDLKYCKEHEGEHLHSEEYLKILRLNNENSTLRHEINAEQDEINSLSEQNKRNENIINTIDDILEKLFGVRHDVGKPNEFEKILKEKAENYKTISDLIPTEPIKVADMLINASKKRTNCMTGEEYDKYIFDKWQLRQIAEHLLIYCDGKGR